MREISYTILDLMEEYGADEEGIRKILEQDDRPEVLLALSPIRENLVEWIQIQSEDRVLEIGSGAGAVTGALARKAKEVLVLDPLLETLEVDKRRHGALGNIRYQCGDLAGLEREMKIEERTFDWVFLLSPKAEERDDGGAERDNTVTAGTLEDRDKMDGRGGRGEGGQSMPLGRRLIERAAAMTAEGGHLVLALPNPQALKLLAGAKADPKELSMSLQELQELFAGLGGQASFYYPLPDHKLPTAVYSDRYLPAKGEVPSLFAEYERPRYRLFSEEAVIDRLSAAGSFPAFANSYLVIWRKGHGANTIC